MTRKRRNTSSPEPDSPPSKKSRPASEEPFDSDSDDDEGRMLHEEPRIDAFTGQKGAFPGLGEDGDGDELFYGPASDGIEYLRMVRSEAKGVPRLLVAPKEDFVDTDLSSNEGGYWVEDAYIATSKSEQVITEDSSPDVQDEYYRSLLLRFDLVRATLKCTPPAEAINALPRSHPISYPRDSNKARLTWRNLVLTTEPKMVQLACMDSESVLGLIGLLTEILPGAVRRRQGSQLKSIGAWIWGCLGRCWEVERLSSEEVAELRDLGKVAVAILVEIRDGLDVSTVYPVEGKDLGQFGPGSPDVHSDTNRNQVMLSEELSRMDDNDEGTEINNAEAKELAWAKARLQSSLNVENGEAPVMEGEQSAKEGHMPIDDEAHNLRLQIQAILDMIITVVGDKYGQKDLLEFRDIWTENEAG